MGDRPPVAPLDLGADADFVAGLGHHDRIEVRGLEVLAYCGVLVEEQARQQPFRLDLDLYVDLGRAGQSDELGDTVDYGAVAEAVADQLATARYQLLERLAQQVAELVLGWSPVVAVTVTATKLRPPVGLHVATTGVRVSRCRAPGGGAAVRPGR